MNRGIEHIGITVPDAEAATRFLADAFAAELIYQSLFRSDEPMGGGDVEKGLGVPTGTRLRSVRLLRLTNGPNIEIFEIDAPEQAQPAGLNDFELNHFAIYTDDAEASVARFRAAGGELLSEPANSLLPTEQADDNRFCYGQTPWGQIIEMITYTHLPYERDTPLRRWHP